MGRERPNGRVIPASNLVTKGFPKDGPNVIVRAMKDYIWAFIPTFATITVGLIAILYFSEFKKRLVAKKIWFFMIIAMNSVLLFFAWPFILALAIKQGIDRLFET